MHFTALSMVIVAIAQYVCALPVETDQVLGLDVTLSQVGHTRIKAVVKNAGSEEVTFVHLNFFRDSAPVKKVTVLKDSMVFGPVRIHCEANCQSRRRGNI